MSYSPNRQNRNGSSTQPSMPKRSPSILVTDSRSSKNRMSAPFAGHAAFGTNSSVDPRTGRPPQGAFNDGNSTKMYRPKVINNTRIRRQPGKFSDISLDNILADNSEVPSGRREERRSNSSWDRFPIGNERLHASSLKKKMMNPLPTRTSKISQKLVLIPEEELQKGRKANFLKEQSHTKRPSLGNIEYNFKKTVNNLPRLTAYNIAEGFNLKVLSNFLEETHDVSPRLYDDCLYVPYILPLLPGRDGFRVKSNISKRIVGGKTLIDRLIDTSEQRDHHYEFFSGVEDEVNSGPDTRNNPHDKLNVNQVNTEELGPTDMLSINAVNQDVFDPSEPQFFAEDSATQTMDTSNVENSSLTSSRQANLEEEDQHAEIFIFHYGVIVFWNFTEMQEKNVLADISFFEDTKRLVLKPLDEQDIETEEFHFEYNKDNNERPRIFNDIITLRSHDHMIKLTLSYAIAQSSKLSRFESRISPLFTAVIKLPKRLALFGTLGMKREQLLKKSGKLFKLRVDVNLSSNILDTPGFFWSIEPSLHPLYVAMREYLEIDKRVQVVNDRCKVFLEFFDICVDSVAEKNIARVTLWFLVVIIVGVLFSFTEIVVRYNIIHNL
ncbi:hypothetical protein KAFR_0J00170 [Kazachstania africana CBS 2517]|uniref:DUF155 domain-containing protein n=1 Tax=Kazachstania africana (strain ATCC 22294 / BCRC 22015 / CBS 2517 / CECT 1963 / NBRC 1671 / NRRL Y-8276) TaxID=1071382 RepID=H2B0D5_KAZAF|nr:hypothetical protein KAFR_0J00170 [Kazachstania africana CBS 2517]CCF60085.1 hypothetical protein KAFR_0J00170 [Kazachstania africana CBS 2517]